MTDPSMLYLTFDFDYHVHSVFDSYSNPKDVRFKPSSPQY